MTQYERGVALERKIQHFFEYHGYYVMRSAGSHGPADLVVIGKDEVKLIQVKLHDKLRDDIREQDLREVTKLANVEAYIAWKPKDGRIQRINSRIHDIRDKSLIIIQDLKEPSRTVYITPLSKEEEKRYQAWKDSLYARFKDAKQKLVSIVRPA